MSSQVLAIHSSVHQVLDRTCTAQILAGKVGLRHADSNEAGEEVRLFEWEAPAACYLGCAAVGAKEDVQCARVLKQGRAGRSDEKE